MCNGFHMNVQTLIPALWGGNSERSERASSIQVVRKHAHRPCVLYESARFAMALAHAVPTCPLKPVKHCPWMILKSASGRWTAMMFSACRPHRQDVEDTDEVVFQIAADSRDAGDEGDALLGIRAVVLGHLALASVRDSVEVPAAICVVGVHHGVIQHNRASLDRVVRASLYLFESR